MKRHYGSDSKYRMTLMDFHFTPSKSPQLRSCHKVMELGDVNSKPDKELNCRITSKINFLLVYGPRGDEVREFLVKFQVDLFKRG